MKTQTTIFRFFWAWNDVQLEQWLSMKAAQGWELVWASPFSTYTFRKTAPAQVSFSLQGPEDSMSEHSWQAVSRTRFWTVWRNTASATPPRDVVRLGKISYYRKLSIILGGSSLPMLVMAPTNGLRILSELTPFIGTVLVIGLVAMALNLYGAARLALRAHALAEGSLANLGKP